MSGHAAFAGPWFADHTEEGGIPPLRHGEGVNAVDLDGDDLPELFLPCVRDSGRLLKNLGRGRFADVTRSLNVGEKGGVGAVVGDLNLDGRPDIYVARGADPYVASNLVYLQQQDGTFHDASRTAGVEGKNNGLTVTLADFNGDGAPDAFLPGWSGDTLLLNDGEGHFSDSSGRAGMKGSSRGWAAVAADFDSDGDLDLFVTHGSPAAPRDNRLYVNRGDGLFDDRTVSAGLGASPWSMGAVADDFDNDGDFDLYVAGYNGQGRLYRNDGHLHFTDVTSLSGITARKVVGATAGMIDGDLLPDLVLGGFSGPVELYKNLGGMKFVRIEDESGLELFPRNEGLTLADLDNDGDLDLYVSNLEGKNHLYLNRLDDPRYLKLRFPAGGPSMVGAVAQLRRNGKVLATQQLSGAVGMAQGPQEILFRLPDSGLFDLRVILPGGKVIEKRAVSPGGLRLP